MYPIVGGNGVPGAHEVLVLSPAHDASSTRSRSTRRRPRCVALRDRAAYHLDAGLRARAAVRQPGPARRARRSSTRTRSSSRSAFVPPHVDARARRASRPPGATSSPTRSTRRGAGPVSSATATPSRGARPRAISPFFVRVALADGRRRASTARPTTRSRALAEALQRRARPPARGARRRRVQRRDRTPRRATTPRPFHWWVDIVPRARRDRRASSWGPASRSTSVAPETRPPRCCARRVRIRVGITIDAPPADVWRVVEPIERHVDWMADAESITFTSTTHARRRAPRFDCVTRVGPLRTTDRMTVTEWEPGRGDGHRAPRASSPAGAGSRSRRRRRGRTRFTWTEELHVPVVDGRRGRRARGEAGAARGLAP